MNGRNHYSSVAQVNKKKLIKEQLLLLELQKINRTDTAVIIRVILISVTGSGECGDM